MMAVFRTDALLFLTILISCAEALSWTDPITCYILDAFLLLYCIVFTALYFRIKLSRLHSDEPVKKDPIYIGLNTNQMSDEYQTLEPARQNQDEQREGQYEALRSPVNDEYQEIQTKSKPRKGKRKARESHSSNRKDVAEVIEMETIPPLPERS